MKEIYKNGIKPILPTKFDENEWFAIAITILIIICVYYVTSVNRKLSWSDIICISLLNLQLTTVGDYFLAMPPYDFYDTVDHNSGEVTDIFLQNIVYPGTVLCLMHFYNPKKLHKFLFILICTFILSALEGISTLFNLFTYKSWKFYYSILFYFTVMNINIIFVDQLTKYLTKRKNMSKGA